MNSILEPLHYQFFINALVVATIAGGLCGAIGVFVVMRGMSYIGHGLSHAIFGWAVASFLFKINFYIGAGLGGFASAVLVNQVARRRTVGADAAIGVVTTAMFAGGVAMISRGRGFARNFDAALFGNVLGVTPSDVLVVSAVALGVGLVIFLRYRALLFTTFDPQVADVSGISTRKEDAILSFILAATIVATMQVLGVTMIAAALVTPAVIARLVTHKFGLMLKISALIGAATGFVGLLLSYYLNIASGASVVLVDGTVFLFTFVATSRFRIRKIA